MGGREGGREVGRQRGEGGPGREKENEGRRDGGQGG